MKAKEIIPGHVYAVGKARYRSYFLAAAVGTVPGRRSYDPRRKVALGQALHWATIDGKGEFRGIGPVDRPHELAQIVRDLGTLDEATALFTKIEADQDNARRARDEARELARATAAEFTRRGVPARASGDEVRLTAASAADLLSRLPLPEEPR